MHIDQFSSGLERIVITNPQATLTIAQMHVVRNLLDERPKLRVICRSVYEPHLYEEEAGPTSAFWKHVLRKKARRGLFPGE